MSKKKLVVLGSTGSIGTQTLDVVSKHPQDLDVIALAAHSNTRLLYEQARRFKVSQVVVADEQRKDDAFVTQMLEDGIRVGFGAQAAHELACEDEADYVLNAFVGAAGLRASYAALKAGKRLALANKESLVVGGELIMPLASHETLLPVDSEHGAIYQCLLGEKAEEIRRIWITASGGPFRGRSRAELALVTKDDALKHPTWKMGPKITIDSATLMNKGLEVIEAHHLFSLAYDDICVLVHPQSCIHSMVEFADGSVKAHLGVTDMRIPIQYALSYPARWDAPLEPLDFRTLTSLEFGSPDLVSFPCLKLAEEAGRAGGTAPAVLNAANEVAVAAFLAQRCRFTDIDYIVETALNAHETCAVESLEQLEAVDAWARDISKKALSRRP